MISAIWILIGCANGMNLLRRCSTYFNIFYRLDVAGGGTASQGAEGSRGGASWASWATETGRAEQLGWRYLICLETWPYTAQEKLVFWASFSIFSQPSGCCHHLHIFAKSAVTLHPSPDPDFGAHQFYGVHSVTTGKTEYAHKDGWFFALYILYI